MILDSLTNSARYDGLGPRFARAWAWLRACDPAQLPDGKTDLGGEVYVLVQRGLTKPLDQVKWEAHRRYADIQYVAQGRERMGWHPVALTQTGEYVAEKDFVPVTTTAGTYFDVDAGTFAVFFPHDAHRPGIALEGADPVVKLVVKVGV